LFFFYVRTPKRRIVLAVCTLFPLSSFSIAILASIVASKHANAGTSFLLDFHGGLKAAFSTVFFLLLLLFFFLVVVKMIDGLPLPKRSDDKDDDAIVVVVVVVVDVDGSVE